MIVGAPAGWGVAVGRTAVGDRVAGTRVAVAVPSRVPVASGLGAIVAVAGGAVVAAGGAGGSLARALVGATVGAGAPQLLIATASTIKPSDL